MNKLIQQLNKGFAILNKVLIPGFEIYQNDSLNFFNQDMAYKNQFNISDISQEQGYRFQAHKEQFMLRNGCLPPDLQNVLALGQYLHWLASKLMLEIAEAFQWQPEELLQLIDPFMTDTQQKNSSIMRIIYYHPDDSRTLSSECHQDLGLLTLLCPTSYPALEVYDYEDQGSWLALEKQQDSQDIIVMAGESLSLLTNQKLLACSHRIRTPKIPRLAITYQLRMRSDAYLNSLQFENEITGNFQKPFKMLAGDFLQNEKQNRQSINGSY
jgi:isopenicillin N synthase-like dioxygenase